MNQKEKSLLGVRVPKPLKKRLSLYCLAHGVKISYFVTEAIKEKLQDMIEEQIDLEIASERLKRPSFVSQKDFNHYLTKRGIKH